jgi:type I restriction enzyme, S subunit
MVDNLLPKKGFRFVENYYKKKFEIPKEWDYLPYTKLLIEVEDPVDFDDNEMYKLITAKRRNGGLVHREILQGKDIKVKKLFHVESDDFIMAKMQIIHGASGLVTPHLADNKISGSYLRFKTAKNLDVEYLNWFSYTPLFFQQTFISSVGSNLEKMNFDKNHWMNHSMPVPPLPEQKKIVKLLNSVDSAIPQKDDEYKFLLLELKKGLIQQLLSGELRLES